VGHRSGGVRFGESGVKELSGVTYESGEGYVGLRGSRESEVDPH
jgi:hypothetical protein